MKKFNCTLTLALLALFASTTVRAADHVKVSEKDGKTTIFALSDDPTVTFTATDLVITAGTKTVNFPLTEGLTSRLSQNQQLFKPHLTHHVTCASHLTTALKVKDYNPEALLLSIALTVRQ